jgi:hypothetical protein
MQNAYQKEILESDNNRKRLVGKPKKRWFSRQ